MADSCVHKLGHDHRIAGHKITARVNLSRNSRKRNPNTAYLSRMDIQESDAHTKAALIVYDLCCEHFAHRFGYIRLQQHWRGDVAYPIGVLRRWRSSREARGRATLRRRYRPLRFLLGCEGE